LLNEEIRNASDKSLNHVAPGKPARTGGKLRWVEPHDVPSGGRSCCGGVKHTACASIKKKGLSEQMESPENPRGDTVRELQRGTFEKLGASEGDQTSSY